MIIFTDDHEAELWRATVAAWIASHREYTGDGDAIAGVAAIADDVVLEYRKRCGNDIGQSWAEMAADTAAENQTRIYQQGQNDVLDALAEARRQGAEHELERIGSALNAKAWDVARVVSAAGLSAEAAERAVTEIKRWADAITRGEWSGEAVDDG